MDLFAFLTVKQLALAVLGVSLLGALASALKVGLETKSVGQAALAFLTAILSIAHFVLPQTKPAGALVEKTPPPPPAGGYVSRHALVALVFSCLALAACAGYWTQARKDAVGATAKSCALKLASDEWALLKERVVHALSTSPTDGDAKALLLAAAVDLAKSAAIEGIGDAIACVSEEVAVLTAHGVEAPTLVVDAGTPDMVVVSARSMRAQMPFLRESDVQRRARLWLEEHPAPAAAR